MAAPQSQHGQPMSTQQDEPLQQHQQHDADAIYRPPFKQQQHQQHQQHHQHHQRQQHHQQQASGQTTDWSRSLVQENQPPRMPTHMERSKTAKSIVFEYCQALKLNTPHVKIVRAPHMPGAFIAWVYIDWFDPPLAFYGSDKRKKEAEHRGMEQLVTYMINNNLVSDITGKPPTRHPLSVVPEIRLNEHAARLLAQCLDQLEAVMPEWAGGIATDPGVGKHAPVSGKGKDFP